jgi:hypothetical protein
MNKWQEHFVKKVEVVRSTSRDRFEQIVIDNVAPVFDDFCEFAKMQGIQATSPLTKNGIRTFRFAITENAYLLMTFRLSGLEGCEANTEFFIPNHDKLPTYAEAAAFRDMDPQWTRTFFEKSLDQFMDSYLESLGDKAGIAGELINQ